MGWAVRLAGAAPPAGGKGLGFFYYTIVLGSLQSAVGSRQIADCILRIED
ncbi:MAG: hypothetical protein NUV76_11645 [Candidatus Kuenenia sp.]|nr:hypothetical protein [Candidatus Kuenenia sp.]